MAILPRPQEAKKSGAAEPKARAMLILLVCEHATAQENSTEENRISKENITEALVWAVGNPCRRIATSGAELPRVNNPAAGWLPMSLSFPTSGCWVGRTPWSPEVPLDPHLGQENPWLVQ